MKRQGLPLNASRTGQRGSALLIVFVFAAILAITLFTELPVLVFEAQRNREQLLIDRGSEYSQAIKLFLRKNGRYPGSLDALENTNRIRYLRKRFKDPFTDKDDWRLLHAGPNGMLIDSKLKQVGNLAGAGSSALGTFAGNSSNAGAGNTNAPGANSNAFGGNSNGFGNSSFGNTNGFGSGNNNGFASGNSNSFGSGNSNGFGSGGTNTGFGNSTSSGFVGFNQQVPTTARTTAGPVNAANPSGAPSDAVSNGIAVDPNQNPTQRRSITDGVTGGQISSTPAVSGTVPAGAQRSPYSVGVVNGNGDPSQQQPLAPIDPNNPNASVSGLINNPNAPTPQTSGAGAFNSSSGVGAAPGASLGGNAFGSSSAPGISSSSGFGAIQSGGLAGVASKMERPSIKLYNEQQQYSLWEFVYDPTKDPARTVSSQGNSAIPGNSPLNQPNTANGQSNPFGGQSGAFGGQSGVFGGHSGTFGSQPSAFGNSNSSTSGSNTSGFGNFGDSNRSGNAGNPAQSNNFGFGSQTQSTGTQPPPAQPPPQ